MLPEEQDEDGNVDVASTSEQPDQAADSSKREDSEPAAQETDKPDQPESTTEDQAIKTEKEPGADIATTDKPPSA